MHFWNVNAVANQLKANTLPEREKMNYYLATTLICVIGVYAPTIHVTPIVRGISFILTAIVSIWGVAHCFAINKTGDNARFVERIICLCVPIVVRLFVYFFFLYLLIIPCLVLLKEYIFIRSILHDLENITFTKPTLISVVAILDNLGYIFAPFFSGLTYGWLGRRLKFVAHHP